MNYRISIFINRGKISLCSQIYNPAVMQEENLIEVNQMNIFKGSYDKLFLNGSLGSTPNNGAATMLFKFF